MAAPVTLPSVTEPFPIFKLAHRYLLYDANTVSYIRREYNICGVLIGGLPQAPQQNVFLGLPVELMPEEARLLVEKRAGYVVDDVASHNRAFLSNGIRVEERRAYQAALRKQGVGAAREASKRTDERKKAALKKLESENWNDIPEDLLKSGSARTGRAADSQEGTESKASPEGDNVALFASPINSVPSGSAKSRGSSIAGNSGSDPYAVTPTTSYPPLQSAAPPPGDPADLPKTPQSYPLFKHLHEEGYFLAPGLRFGCQYMAYPGDPLRFHSHFLCNGMDWDQEFDLLDLVGGGRLGTGVKKGFLIGGLEEGTDTTKGHKDDKGGGARAFCIEWGGM